MEMEWYHAIEFTVKKQFVSAAIELKHHSRSDETLARLLIELRLPSKPSTESTRDEGASAVMRTKTARCTVEELCGFHGYVCSMMLLILRVGGH